MTSAGKGPARTCIGCRQSKNPDQLVRYVVAPDGHLLVDYRQRLPGRGAYTCVDMNCLRQAVERKQFQRSFRGKCQEIDFDLLADSLQNALVQKIFNLIGMARKSGQLISGSNVVMAALRQAKDSALVLIAEDISTGIAVKVSELAKRRQIPCEQMFGKEAYGQLLGKAERSVVAVQAGALAEALLTEMQRYKQIVREN